MQLHIARLCLDCDELHAEQSCPICGSESFAYISRWIPTPERRPRPRPEPANETAETYRQLLDADRQPAGIGRWMTRGVLGLAAVGMAGWAWRGSAARRREKSARTSSPSDTSVG
jgi:predicted  nucleic acid-binding Zn-ribbon protein